jgi:hypothetical protein
MLAASAAGRVGEDGSGALWIAPELVPAPTVAQNCSQLFRLDTTELVFEIIRDEGQSDLAQVAALSRNRVFDWNPKTGELVFTGASPVGMFGGMESRTVRFSSAPVRSCGSG